jgi:hypothetical protein
VSRRICALFAGLLLAAPAAAEPVDVDVTPLALDPAASGVTRVGRLEYLGGFILRSDDREFGGLSGLLVDDERAVMISDRGLWLTARLRHDVTGRLRGIDDVDIAPMADLGGGTIAHRRGLADAEALTRLPDGRLVVAFEQRHRLWIYGPGEPPAAAKPTQLALPMPLQRADANGGVEAIARLPDGRLALLTESLRWKNGSLVGWLLDGRRGSPVEYVTEGEFVPTDLAVLPEGDLLVLERRFSLLGGVGARLRLVPAAEISGRVWQPQLVARLEAPLAVDNFEGLAVADRGDGDPLVYIVSDDNFNALQRTLLLQFRLLPAP